MLSRGSGNETTPRPVYASRGGGRPEGVARGRDRPLQDPSERRRFDDVVLPHLDAAFNLARWLTRNEHDAEDVVQEAYLRAFRFWESFRGADPRAWLLAIVRNTCFTWLHQNRKPVSELDENMPDLNSAAGSTDCI